METRERPELNPRKVGAHVTCATCGDTKKPIGRSGPLGASYCTDECEGYSKPPHVGSLWPGESEAEFGYSVGNVGVVEISQ